MSKTLTEIVQQLKDANKKVQLIYAFNGTGKTRLSREFKQLVAPKGEGEEAADPPALSRSKILYFNAFTEDLFYWDNDLSLDAQPRLRIQPNSFTDWLLAILRELGQDGNIIRYFQHYTSDKLTPHFSEDFSEVTFSFERGNDERLGNIKISKGEESNFIWSIFYTLLDQVISTRNVAEPEDRETREFDELEYVFIDDPVSSLDENHLIELAVNLAGLIKASPADLKFVITTHSPLFYNVLHNELGLNKGGKKEGCYLLGRLDDGSFDLCVKYGDSNKSFSYHLHLRQTLEQAIAGGQVQRYHFTLLRNLYEKTASFLGYPQWSELLPDDKQAYLNRIVQFTSHSTLSNESVTEPTPQEKLTVKLLLDHLVANYGYWQQDEALGACSPDEICCGDVGEEQRMSEITRTSDYGQALATIKQHIQSSQKAGGFKPEYIGKLNLYLSVLSDQLRAADDHWPDPMQRQGQTGCEVRVVCYPQIYERQLIYHQGHSTDRGAAIAEGGGSCKRTRTGTSGAP